MPFARLNSCSLQYFKLRTVLFWLFLASIQSVYTHTWRTIQLIVLFVMTSENNAINNIMSWRLWWEAPLLKVRIAWYELAVFILVILQYDTTFRFNMICYIINILQYCISSYLFTPSFLIKYHSNIKSNKIFKFQIFFFTSYFFFSWSTFTFKLQLIIQQVNFAALSSSIHVIPSHVIFVDLPLDTYFSHTLHCTLLHHT